MIRQAESPRMGDQQTDPRLLEASQVVFADVL
jgi:hypothetical protein